MAGSVGVAMARWLYEEDVAWAQLVASSARAQPKEGVACMRRTVPWLHSVPACRFLSSTFVVAACLLALGAG